MSIICQFGCWYLSRKITLCASVIFNISLLFSFPSVAESKALVVFPVVKEPYSTIFSEMVDGFRASFSGRTEAIGVSSVGGKQVEESVKNLEPDLIVALSSIALQVIDTERFAVPLLVGAVAPETDIGALGGVSMLPGADIYLRELLVIYPKVESVFFVYDPERDSKILQESLEFLEGKHIEAKAVPAMDIRTAAIAYKDFLIEAKPGDVVWLYPNNTLINSSLLSSILDTAWKRKLVVFSSNPVHVKRGALFALYPDNAGIGRRLGDMANQLSVNKFQKTGIEPLRYVKLVVNARTSDHLGLSFPDEVKQKMDLILPGR